MRARFFTSVVLFLILRSAPGAQRPAASEPVQLPVRRVVLYKSGVGYFEHLGRVTGSADVAIQFTSGQLNDVLASLTALDLDNGRISSISYNSVAPVAQRLNALRLQLGPNAGPMDFYRALRGARVDVRAGATAIDGRLLGIERKTRTSDRGAEQVDVLTVISDAGAVRTVVLGPEVTVRIGERDLRDEIGRYLEVVASGREEDVRRMTLTSSGVGTRRLLVSYVSEVPIWKSTYRLVLPDTPGGKPLIQGWAVVDNTVGEDWTDVELSLVAGAPQSFIQEISRPYYARRPVVPLPPSVMLAPQTHEATLQTANAPPPAAEPEVAAPAERVTKSTAPGGAGGRLRVDQAVDGRDRTALMNAVAPAASAQDLGDLFEYRLTEPVTILENQSALVPILNASVTAERVSLWNRAAGSGRPLRAVWLTNGTTLTLDGGALSVIDGNAFAGEGLVDTLKPGEKRLVWYGTDLGVLVDARLDERSGRYTRVIARDGLLLATREERNRWVYRVRNEDVTTRTLVIERPVAPGWTLDPDPAPAETTAAAARFRLPIEAKKEATLSVTEHHRGGTTLSIGEIDPKKIAATFEGPGVPVQALQRALQPVFDKRAEVAAAETRATAVQAQIARIAQDQERLRENMKALHGGGEERSLAERYTRELNDQEDRLASPHADLEKATADRDAHSAELSRLVQQLAFDIQGG